MFYHFNIKKQWYQKNKLIYSYFDKGLNIEVFLKKESQTLTDWWWIFSVIFWFCISLMMIKWFDLGLKIGQNTQTEYPN